MGHIKDWSSTINTLLNCSLTLLTTTKHDYKAEVGAPLTTFEYTAEVNGYLITLDTSPQIHIKMGNCNYLTINPVPAQTATHAELWDAIARICNVLAGPGSGSRPLCDRQ